MEKRPRHIIRHEVVNSLANTLTGGFLEDPEYFESGLKSIQEIYQLAPEQLRGMTVAQYFLECFENDIGRYPPESQQVKKISRAMEMISFLREQSANDDTGQADQIIISTIRMMINLSNLDFWKLINDGIKSRIKSKVGGAKGSKSAPAIVIAIQQVLPKLKRLVANAAWDHIDKNCSPENPLTVIDECGQEHEIYIDGDSICQTNPYKPIKKSTFPKYFKKAKENIAITK
ncbi:hypothetical protein DSCW_07680 [Desulfosarcina widdelii]|uniref:Uncharacterized protein n=1 Tax=Desulfosarcina widdelii TaxID=947919 RepID=A0A5K7Z1I1_9BACT|nr:hypothetical protein [Desulfosarcina widdelii]BBO73351.1 hypothetical protein DSCW_07680 [Desulfosarcina widdelii]